MLKLIKHSQLDAYITDGENVICNVGAELPDYELTALKDIIDRYNELTQNAAAGHGGMLDIKALMLDEYKLFQNGNHLITFKVKDVVADKRFRQIIDRYNYIAREIEQRRMIKMPAAVGDTVRHTGIGSNMTVLEHGLLVEINGEAVWINVAGYEAMRKECDRQEDSARMQRLF